MKIRHAVLGLATCASLNLSPRAAGAASYAYDCAYWNRAKATATYNSNRFGHTFATSPTQIGYAANVLTNSQFWNLSNARSDQWNNFMVYYADMTMKRSGTSAYDTHALQTWNYTGKYWDLASGCTANYASKIGGYYPSAAMSDGYVDPFQPKYTDDNALSGLAFMEAYDRTGNPSHLQSARSIANWLYQNCNLGQRASDMSSTGQFRGFWWSTNRQMHPTQANGLAMELYIRLYGADPQSYYYGWATAIRSWLKTNRYNSSQGLYSWHEGGMPICVGSAMASCCPNDASKEVCQNAHNVYFTYDNAIMLSALMAFYEVTGDPNDLAEAQSLAASMTSPTSILWNASANAYKTWGYTYLPTPNLTGATVSPVFSGWASAGLQSVYAVDGNTTWRNRATQNLDSIVSLMSNGNGFFTGWGNGSPTNLSNAVDQGSMQRVLALWATTPGVKGNFTAMQCD